MDGYYRAAARRALIEQRLAQLAHLRATLRYRRAATELDVERARHAAELAQQRADAAEASATEVLRHARTPTAAGVPRLHVVR